MSMWLEDLQLKVDDGDYYFDRDELESWCDELEIKLEEGRAELTRREEEADD